MTGDSTPPPEQSIQHLKHDITHPFFLGTGDRPGYYFTPTRLRADNYEDWAGDLLLALQARRKVGFLDGSITGPMSPYTETNWLTVNAMIVCWIMNRIDPEVKVMLTKFRHAHKLWEHLKTRFAIVNGPRIHQIKSAIARCEQLKTMSVSTYYGKLNVLWEELLKHEPLIKIACCAKCDAGLLHETRRETQKLHDFLMGLYSDYYDRLRTQISSTDPLASLDRTYQLVVQEERVRSVKSPHEDKPPDVLGFAVRAPLGRGHGSNDRPTCSQCNKIGHEASRCWSFLVCSHCKRHGHEVSKCYELVGYLDGSVPKARTSHPTASNSRGSVKAHATAVVDAAATSAPSSSM